MGLVSEDEWQRRATEAAIAEARDVVAKGGINSRAQVGSLSDVEWGWIVCGAIFAWISTKAEQAVAEGCSYEIPIRNIKIRSPRAWEDGAIRAILPALSELEGVDWDKPVSQWTKNQITALVWQAYRLTTAALAARDEGASRTIVKYDRARQDREISAEHGGPLMSQEEMEEMPFYA